MLFPSATYNPLTFNIDTLVIPRGVNDGSRSTTESSTIANKAPVNYQTSLRPRAGPSDVRTSAAANRTRAIARGMVGKVTSGAIRNQGSTSGPSKDFAITTPVNVNLNGSVVIGNVQSRFLDNAAPSTSPNKIETNTNPRPVGQKPAGQDQSSNEKDNEKEKEQQGAN